MPYIRGAQCSIDKQFQTAGPLTAKLRSRLKVEQNGDRQLNSLTEREKTVS